MFIALSINLSIYRISIFRCIYCYLIIALFIFYQLLFDIFTDFFFIYLVIDWFIIQSTQKIKDTNARVGSCSPASITLKTL